MNLLPQKTERIIGIFEPLVYLAAGIIIGIGATMCWYALRPRPGPAGQTTTPRVAISPRTTPGPGEKAAKSVTERQEIQITAKGHAKGPAKLAQSATSHSETPIKTGKYKIPSEETIGGPDPRIPGPEEAENAPGGTVGGTVINASSGMGSPQDGQAARKEQPAEPELAAAGGEPLTESVATPRVAFHVGDRAEGTVTGELEIVDAAGRPVTTEPLTITGEYILDFPAPGKAELDLRFTAPAVLSVDFPRLSRSVDPLRMFRLSASTGWFVDRPFTAVTGEYIRRWPIIGGLSAWAGGEAGWAWTLERAGPVGRIGAGIEYRF